MLLNAADSLLLLAPLCVDLSHFFSLLVFSVCGVQFQTISVTFSLLS